MAIFDLFNYGFSAAIVMGLLVYVATSYATYLAFVPCNGFRYMLIANNLEIINPTGINPVLLKIGGFVSFVSFLGIIPLLGFIFGIVGGICTTCMFAVSFYLLLKMCKNIGTNGILYHILISSGHWCSYIQNRCCLNCKLKFKRENFSRFVDNYREWFRQGGLYERISYDEIS